MLRLQAFPKKSDHCLPTVIGLLGDTLAILII